MVRAPRARTALPRARPPGGRVPGPERGRARPDGHRARAGAGGRDARRRCRRRSSARRSRSSQPSPSSRPPRPRTEAPRAPVLGEESTSPQAQEVREVVGAIAAGLGLGATLHVGETDDAVTATLSGGELGVVIGKHGKTIDAVQYLVNAMRARDGQAKPVVIDAQNYRRRREQALQETAERAAGDAIRTGAPVALDPMTSVERKIVHLLLKDRDRRRDHERRPRALPAHRGQPAARRLISAGCASRPARRPRRAGRRAPTAPPRSGRPARPGSRPAPASRAPVTPNAR